MKIPISTIRAIMKNFNQHKRLRNCLEDGVCLYRPNARWGGVWVVKDSPRNTAGELQKIVESQGHKTLKRNGQTFPHTSPHVIWEGFKKNDPLSSKNNLQHIQLSDTTGTSNGTGFYGQMKQKKKVFSSKHSRWVWWTQGYKAPHVYNEIYCCSFDVVGLYLWWRYLLYISWTSCLDAWYHGYYQIPTSDWIF